MRIDVGITLAPSIFRRALLGSVATGAAAAERSRITIGSDRSLHLDFTLARASTVTIDIVDAAGRIAWHEAARFYDEGEQEISIPAGTLLPGLYFYTIAIDGIRRSEKFIVTP